MQRSDIPTKIPVAFARDADGAHKRTIPLSTPFAPGGATFEDGWTNINFLPTASGGIPPFGQEFNGLFEIVTKWLRWAQASATSPYDSTFQASISGYPLGARVESGVTPGLIWVSTAESNVANPDAGGSGWSVPFFPDPFIGGLIVRALGGGQGANIKFEGSGATSPNKYIRAINGSFEVVNHAYNAVIFGVSNAGDVYSIRNLSAAGTVSGAAITAANGNVLANNGSFAATFDASIGRNLSVGNQSQVNGNSFFGTTGQFYAGMNGANRLLNFVNGEYLQWVSGQGFVLNTGGGSISLNAPATTYVSHDVVVGQDIHVNRHAVVGGNVQATTINSVNGNITANNGRVRMSFGARGSGDGAAAVILSDFLWSATQPGYVVMPNGLILQWGTYSATTNALSPTGNAEVLIPSVSFPLAFPIVCAVVMTTPLDVDDANLQETAWHGAQTRFGCGFGLGCRQAGRTMTGEYLAIGW